MMSEDFSESDRRLEGNLLQVEVTKPIESFKSVTTPSLEQVTKKVSIEFTRIET